MTVALHLLLFLGSGMVIWMAAGRLIEIVDRLAKTFRQSGFTVAFFVLGFLTSISELSVMVNSSINGEPQASAGNLAGASIVLLLFLVPALAIMGNGIRLGAGLTQVQLALALIAAALPTLTLLDGNASRIEGFACVLGYVLLLALVRRAGPISISEDLEDVLEEVVEQYVEGSEYGQSHSLILDAVQILAGAALIFVAGNFLVEETVYFSDLLHVPSSLIGLLLLSVGTNVPEIFVAVRSVRQGQTGIAFGNYVGSSLTNAMLFGFLVLINGRFAVEVSEYVVTAVAMALGFTAFFFFAKTQNRITRMEGYLLVFVYISFVALELVNSGRSGA